MSGGGFRATAWGLGAVCGIVRARELEAAKADDIRQSLTVASVASVSGGSIANAALALRVDAELDDVTSAELLAGLKPTVRHVAFDGLLRYAPATNKYVATAFSLLALAVGAMAGLVGALVAIARPWSATPFLLWGSVGGTAACLLAQLGFAIFHRSTHVAERVLVGALCLGIGIGFGGGAAIVLDASTHRDTRLIAAAVLAIVLAAIAIKVLALRGERLERALERTVLKRDAGTVELADIERHTHHVFCATELQSGDHFFMTPRMLYGYQFGRTTTPGNWTLAHAVQASAALPGGFPPQRTLLKDVVAGHWAKEWQLDNPPPIGDADRVVLVDGGVYDNMATEWELGFGNRNRNMKHKLADLQKPADFLVVANAGKSLPWKRIWPLLIVRREVVGLMRDQSIQYDQTTATRRRSLIGMFRAAEAGAEDLPNGVIVQASTSPYDLVEESARRNPDASKRQRAEAWKAPLAALDDNWKEMARCNAAVPTVLHRLGERTTVDLLWHAAVLTQVQLHVHYGIGKPEPFQRSEFEALVK